MKTLFWLALTALTLTGCIPSLLASGAATGGTVISQERSAGNAVDDTTIRFTLNTKYLDKDVNDLFKNVSIHVTEGRVLLTGDVNKPETSIEAVRIAWTVKGVREVINEIQVTDKSSFVDYARDVWISSQIRAKYLLEKNFHNTNYSVETVNGVVYLMGIAKDQAELDKANYIASITSYVQRVVSHVILRDDPRRKGM